MQSAHLDSEADHMCNFLIIERGKNITIRQIVAINIWIKLKQWH